VRYEGEIPLSPDFLAPRTDGELAKWLPNGEYVMYLRGTAVQPVGNVTILFSWRKNPRIMTL
jgi:hypothetical protein